MGKYYKNRRRCNIDKKRLESKKLFVISLLSVFILSILLTIFIDKRINHLLKKYIDLEVEKLSSKIVSNSIKKISPINSEKIVIIKKNNKNEIEKISYNTQYINNIKEEITEIIENEISNIEKGNYEEFGNVQQEISKEKYNKWIHGFVCEVNINSIQGSTLYGNVGPSIPIKLSFLTYAYVDTKMDIKEYGINNVLVQLDIIVRITNVVSMPITSRKKEVVISQPLSIEILQGKIPSYYGGIMKINE